MTKFRDMTDSERLEIINAIIVGDPLEVSCNGETWYDFKDCTPYLVINQFYRIPKRPMSIDWSVLKDEYICAARDKYDNAFAYMEGLEKTAVGWYSPACAAYLNGLKSYDPGTVDWQDSLIWRPGYGDNK